MASGHQKDSYRAESAIAMMKALLHDPKLIASFEQQLEQYKNPAAPKKNIFGRFADYCFGESNTYRFEKNSEKSKEFITYLFNVFELINTSDLVNIHDDGSDQKALETAEQRKLANHDALKQLKKLLRDQCGTTKEQHARPKRNRHIRQRNNNKNNRQSTCKRTAAADGYGTGCHIESRMEEITLSSGSKKKQAIYTLRNAWVSCW